MKRQRGFTLIELIVVIMVLGILATVAVPKFLDATRPSVDNGLQQTLAVVRDAIEIYAAQHNGDLPGQSGDLPGDLKLYLLGSFPASPVGARTATIAYTTGALSADNEPTTGWKYATDTGEFICNSGETTKINPDITYADF